jgi:hypothetical protein
MTESIPGFSLYNENLGEITSDDLGIIMGKVSMPIAPSISAQMEDVPALYGQKFEGTNYGTKQIVIPFTWIAESTDYEQNRRDFYSTIRSLSQTFVRPYDGTMELALQFDEDPEITYWGHITEVATPTEIIQGDYSFSSSITFEMSDPRGVMPRVTQEIKPNAIDTENTNFAYDTSDAKTITDKNLNFLYRLDDSIAHKGSNLWLSFDWSNQNTATSADTFTVYRVVKFTKDSGRSDDRRVMATDRYMASSSTRTSNGTKGHYSRPVSLTPVSSDIPSSQIAGVYAYIQVTNPTNFSVEHFHLHTGSTETPYSGVRNLVNQHQITTTVSVDGTAETEPELSIIPNADQYYLGYTLNDDGYMGIGADESQTIDAADGTTVTPAREVITSDGCGSLANWTTDPSVVNSLRIGLKKNVVQGEFQSNQDATAIIVGSYQDGLTPPHSRTHSSMDDDNINIPKETWYGPVAVYQGITTALDNFEISTILHHEVYKDSGSVHNTRAVGTISLLLLDENNIAWGAFTLKGSAVNGYGGTAPFARIQFTEKGGNFGTQPTVGNKDKHQHYQPFSTYTKGRKTPLLAGVKWNAKGQSSTYQVAYGTVTKTETKITKKKAYKSVRVKNGKYKTGKKRGKQKYKTIRKAYTKTSKKTYKKTIQKYVKEKDANTLLSSDVALQFWLRKYKNRFWYKVVELSTSSYRPLRKSKLKQNNTWIEITDKTFLSWAKNYKLGNVALVENKYPLEEDFARVVQKKADRSIPANEKYKDAYLSLVDLQITKLNYLEEVDGASDEPKEVAKRGQDVIFDSEDEEITVENSMVEPVWISNYPKLKPGINTISIFGSDLRNAEIVLSYYPRTL